MKRCNAWRLPLLTGNHINVQDLSKKIPTIALPFLLKEIFKHWIDVFSIKKMLKETVLYTSVKTMQESILQRSNASIYPTSLHKQILSGSHHHHVVLVARISLTLSLHFSLSFIASGRSSGQHPVSSHSCWMYVRAGRPAFARPCVGVHKSTSLMSSSLLLQQCPACLVHLTWIVFVIGGRWPYSWCLVRCCHQDFEFQVFHLLDWLPYHGQFALMFSYN